ncbi:AAA family ATPase [Vibrio cholerae]|uniref:ATP-dependent nuclease n=1 Tax=Vibrio cholerae TaxID=666 RepID=UPI000E0AD264|nr:AAA family ATPase [Vibrio cholerae]EGQ9833733.1 AAA family ATPase [Vibrio cholerae]EJL6470974.1 AAA family ATPase [Vibrio cholerae]EJL6716560.1 AAA family ATPase [Vibrio cholerae]EJO4030891.1 AAA family ATPase [Vibrio cholerae]EKF9634362.1 AAA family ATPase [Vibrio cholerae]
MTHILKAKIKNFKKFREYEIYFDPKRNILVGDNEAGKSTILTAIELVLSGSRSKIESLGIEALLNASAVSEFLTGEKNINRLPSLHIELFLNDVDNPDLNGRNNSDGTYADGLQLICEPNEELSTEIRQVLDAEGDNFPFEFYVAKFITFSGDAYSSYRKFLRFLSIDSTQINNEYANSQYVKAMYEATVDKPVRYSLMNRYRQQKNAFRDTQLNVINDDLEGYDFAIRSGSKFNLETDLTLTEEGIPIENRGKGKQCFIKTAFALRERAEGKTIDVLLLEEPENHLSHTSMYKLIGQVEKAHDNQVIIATHSSLISSRLDLRKSILLNSAAAKPATLTDLTKDTAKFFAKAPNHNVLEHVLSEKVILVEGDAEYILMECLYERTKGHPPSEDGVHIISVGGTSFKRYMEVSKLLSIRTAVIRDNDSDYQKNCIDNYRDYQAACIAVYADKDDTRTTFEICMYQDNKEICDDLFSEGKIQLEPQEYMLKNKTTAAFRLLDEKANEITVPPYIREAIEWISE